MSYSAIITLTYGSEAGPFDLYSDVDGYVTPFVTNVPAASFTYGYYTTSVPDGTLIIKVKSDGECINYIDLSVLNIPSPTPTNTPTQTVTPTQTRTPNVTSTPTQTQTQTQTPSSTIGSTPTQTPSPTPTMTAFTGPCICVEMTATNTDPEGPAGSISYNNCFGTLVGEIFNTTGTRYRCVDYTGGVIQVFSSTNVTYGPAVGYSCSLGTCPTTTVIPLTPTPTQTQTNTPTPSSTIGSTPTQTPSNTATPTQTGTPNVTPTQTQTPSQTVTQTPSPSPSPSGSTNYTISWTNNSVTTGTNALRIYKNSILIVEQFGLGSNSFSVTSTDVITYNLTSTTPDFTDVQIVDSDYGTIQSCGFNSATIGQTGGYTYTSNATIDGITTNYAGGCP